MIDPGLGDVDTPRRLAVFGDRVCRIRVEGCYDADERKVDFHVALDNLRKASFDVMRAAEPHVYRYYQEVNANFTPDDEDYLDIATPAQVWNHVQFGAEAYVTRRLSGDRAVYVSIECNCDWEPEHGLQIVLRHGNEVCKVGPYDGHLTNADAYADENLETVIYR